jgi:hypothetical protein
MMSEKELLELKIDDNNEIIFKVVVEGTESAEPAKTRFVCEGGQTNFMFKGDLTEEGNVRFVIPPLRGAIKEDKVCNGRIEVLVENRYFVPVEFDVVFVQPVKIFTESVDITSVQPDVEVFAKHIVKQEQKKIVARPVEQPAKVQKVIPEVKKQEVVVKPQIVAKKVIEQPAKIAEVKKQEIVSKPQVQKPIEKSIKAQVIPEVKKQEVVKPVIADKPQVHKTATGIDEATMRDVAASIFKKLKDKL